MDEHGRASESPAMDQDSDNKMEPDGDDSDGIQNMFASVWVKVEVNDDKEEESDHLVIDAEDMEQSQNNSGIQHCKKFYCDQCEYTTSFKTCMKRHALGHLNIKPYACSQCPYAAMYPGALQRHIIKHQIDNGDERAIKYFCDSCEYSTYYKYSLRAHKRKHSLEKMYKCSQCTYSTAYRGSFVKHQRMHKNEPRQYKCEKCPFVTKYPGHIYRHRAKIHHLVTGDAKACSYCDFSTVLRWRLNQHVMRSKQDQLLHCRQCDFETYYMCQIRKHKSEHQKAYRLTVENGGKKVTEIQKENDVTEVNEDPIEQNADNIEAEKIANLTTDIIQLINNATSDANTNKITNSSDTNIPKVNDENETNDNVSEMEGVIDTKSIKVLQSGDSSKPFQCSKCSYSSRLKAPVQRHFRRHHTSHNRPYKCTNCDFSTKTKDNLQLHTRRSKSEILLDCNSCTFSTQFKCTLVMHQKEHYAHKCTLCSYSCRNRHDIQRHFNVVHLDGGTKCRFCNFKSGRKESVLCHETIHTGEKPFKCKFCDYKTVRNSLLTIHFRKHHEGMECF